ncbi:peptidase M61, partial [Hydrogenovibrio sp. SC-1]|uniref:PDZ domain-containing protein n=1 Tax=Hydrogenovibrio sp. SC-1 TaxID=2065820 RepID=UPI000CC1B967
SYYNKGGLIALALDLIIQAKTDGQKSLDTVLLHLWQHYGQTATGLEDGDIERLCSQVSGVDLSHFFETALYGTEDLDFESLFEPFGIQFSLRAATELKDLGGQTPLKNSPPSLGVNCQTTENQTLLLTHVWQAQSAAQAGLAAGDEIIALDGLKVKTLEGFEKQLSRYQPGDTLSCAFFRRDELMQTDILLQPPVKDRVVLSDLDAAHRSFLPWPAK